MLGSTLVSRRFHALTRSPLWVVGNSRRIGRTVDRNPADDRTQGAGAGRQRRPAVGHGRRHQRSRDRRRGLRARRPGRPAADVDGPFSGPAGGRAVRGRRGRLPLDQPPHPDAHAGARRPAGLRHVRPAGQGDDERPRHSPGAAGGRRAGDGGHDRHRCRVREHLASRPAGGDPRPPARPGPGGRLPLSERCGEPAGGRGQCPPALRLGEEACGHGRAPARAVQRPKGPSGTPPRSR